MNLAWQIIFAFGSMVACDFTWAKYVKAAAHSRPLKAASWSLLLFIFNGIVVITYVANNWMLIPAMAGAFVGTYLGARK